MTVQNVVVCDQNPNWFRAATPDDPSCKKELAMDARIRRHLQKEGD